MAKAEWIWVRALQLLVNVFGKSCKIFITVKDLDYIQALDFV
ncbi:hypothetical protein [Candidatus Cyrtobacter comes]|nr:hypothetical protein [Candidatus Cyrtobacter comes]